MASSSHSLFAYDSDSDAALLDAVRRENILASHNILAAAMDSSFLRSSNTDEMVRDLIGAHCKLHASVRTEHRDSIDYVLLVFFLSEERRMCVDRMPHGGSYIESQMNERSFLVA